jgi:2'-5' RNA ligase
VATRDALAAAARELRRSCGGRSPPAQNLHLTLAFLGGVYESRLAELTDCAAALATAPFELTLDHIGYWRAQRLVWAGTHHCPDQLAALADALAEGLRARGFRAERRPFKPHVTLLRDASASPAQAEVAFGSLTWRARSFVLACSEPAARGVRYRIIGEWPLSGAGL